MSDFPHHIQDNFGRPINYLRLAVTDRCNLRCFYCMPESGIQYIPRKELLSYEEMIRLIGILYRMGVNKLRVTGGEPFVRKDLMKFLKVTSRKFPELEIALTTNGILTVQYLEELERHGIKKINLSLDTLDSNRFFEITRRNEFDTVWNTFEELVSRDFQIKINMVVMEGKNIQDILPMVNLTKGIPVSVRFIEEMPFNGNDHQHKLNWDHQSIINHIKQNFPELIKIEDPQSSTAFHYAIPGHKGNIGVIAAYTRLFCGSCNRIRITAKGVFKTCLYDNGVLDLKQLLRSGKTDKEIETAIRRAINQKPRDGFAAERNRTTKAVESMSTIGG